MTIYTIAIRDKPGVHCVKLIRAIMTHAVGLYVVLGKLVAAADGTSTSAKLTIQTFPVETASIRRPTWHMKRAKPPYHGSVTVFIGSISLCRCIRNNHYSYYASFKPA